MNCFEFFIAALSLIAGVVIGAWVAESYAWYFALGSGIFASLAIFGGVNLIGYVGGLLHNRGKEKK